MTESKAVPTKRVLCKACQQVTNHRALHIIEKNEYDDESEIGVSHAYQTLECLGCGNICFLDEYTCSEDFDPETGQPDVTYLVYPSPNKDAREAIERIYYVPDTVRVAYEETVGAINAGLVLLTAVGVRLTIEAFCIDQNIKADTLEKRIDKMRENRIISEPDATSLHVARKMGNNSAHKLKKQGKDALSLAIDIIESLLRQAYIHPKRAKSISEGWQVVESRKS